MFKLALSFLNVCLFVDNHRGPAIFQLSQKNGLNYFDKTTYSLPLYVHEKIVGYLELSLSLWVRLPLKNLLWSCSKHDFILFSTVALGLVKPFLCSITVYTREKVNT